jgi:flagellar basal-body rod protein FlgC
MAMDRFFTCLDISASGLKAERIRMDVVAQNIANASTTQTEEGLPYRRRQVLFETVLGEGKKVARGVRVRGVTPDESPFLEVFEPGHPDANAEGVVLYPNVKVPSEMVDMITAARAYEANLNLIKTFRDMVERALSLGR